MTASAPAALILPTPAGDSAATLTALGAQRLAPGSVLLVGALAPGRREDPAPQTFATPAAALDAATLRGEWVWLLDAGVEPDPAALERLVAALTVLPAEPPVGLLASQVRTADGALDRASLPGLDSARHSRVLSALAQRAVALRAARYGSLLVHLPSALEAGARTGSGRMGPDLAWTARLLAQRAGVLVPSSVVVRRTGRRPVRPFARPADVLAGAKLLAEIAPDERLWFFVRMLIAPPKT